LGDNVCSRRGLNELELSIRKTSELLRKREVSPVDLTKNCLARIEELNPLLNAFITVTADSALAQARQAEIEIQRGDWRGPMHGIPLALKDIIDTAGVLTTAGSAQFKSRIPHEDADVVRRLRDAGAIFLGKQNLHEFAYGGSSVVSNYGPVRNPWNPAHIAGGSSGGSAASVATGLGYASIGTDTAGSIREPAALCGVVGLKPSYARVSSVGVFPLSRSLDHVGPITRSVADAAILLQVLADPGAKNSSGIVVGVPDYSARLGHKPSSLKVGIPRSFFYEEIDSEVASIVEQALWVIQSLSPEMRDISLTVDTDRTLQLAESYAVHAEFAARSPELYQPETLRRIRGGENFSESQMIEGRRRLEQSRREIQRVFEEVDVLVTPTAPIAAPILAELQQYPDQLRPAEIVMLRNTRPFNVWGVPAISFPCGFTTAGLPIGLQISGPHWGEAVILQLAHAYEQATGWHKHRPGICTDLAK
jgi:aspartyl-tRNA(Asn)/glutamyl-tRNA(Gln) amidotransferase subunit A